MPGDWDPTYKHRVYPIDAPPEASQRERDQFRQNLKRAARLENGRCPYCGKVPEPGYVRCAHCLDLQSQSRARASERRRARRDAERRAAQPRSCSHCGGPRLTRCGIRNGRQRYLCRDCSRRSFGDGLPPPPGPPMYPCPYCGGRCVKGGHATDVARKPQLYLCHACGRKNTNLWPQDTPSPGGPFPRCIQFGLNYPALDALLIYCQEKKRSVAQAIREIFILAAKVPPVHASTGRGHEFKSPMIRAYLAAADARTAPPLPTVPPGDFRLPSANPASFAKLAEHRSGNRFNPTVLIARRVTVLLSDLALASLREMMRRRHLNHQDTARALVAETNRAKTPPTVIAIPRTDLDDDW